MGKNELSAESLPSASSLDKYKKADLIEMLLRSMERCIAKDGELREMKAEAADFSSLMEGKLSALRDELVKCQGLCDANKLLVDEATDKMRVVDAIHQNEVNELRVLVADLERKLSWYANRGFWQRLLNKRPE